MTLSIKRYMVAASNRVTLSIGARWGDTLPFYYVIEAKKSGGTWFGQMLADCLNLPFPKSPVLPLAMPAVVHAHWWYDARLRRVAYVSRDGRDRVVSAYFHVLRTANNPSVSVSEARRRLLIKLAGPGVDFNDAAAVMPRWIEYLSSASKRDGDGWTAHVLGWVGKPHVVHVTYEALLADTAGELARAIRELTGADADSWRIEMAVDKFSMARQTGRKPGEEDPNSFIRKGIAGDWKNYFNHESRTIYDRLAGDALIRLGYAKDHSWVDEPTPADRVIAAAASAAP